MTDAELTALRDERDRLRVELDEVRDITGVVRHTSHEDCQQCGCVSLSASEAVAELRVSCDALRVELEQQRQLNLQLAERLAACSQVLGRAAERKGFDLAAVVAAQAHKAGVGAIMGQWPGDETDAEIQAALAAERGEVCECQTQGGVR